jgi:uncharacterized LabA/DUF88 family protein
MNKQKVNIAYIDAANVDRALKSLNWKIDYARFRVWLKDKYQIERAYIFIGLIPKYSDLYTYLSDAGFTLVFKEVVYQNGSDTPKGNCDTDLIMQAMSDYYEGNLNKAVLVSSDGDYAPLVKKFNEKDSFYAVVSPALSNKCSILLKKIGVKISYINDQRPILEQKQRKNPQ